MDSALVIWFIVTGVLILLSLASILSHKVINKHEAKETYERMIAEIELSVWQFPLDDFKSKVWAVNITPPLNKSSLEQSKQIATSILENLDIPKEYHSKYVSDNKINSYFSEIDSINHKMIVDAIKEKHDVIAEEDLSSHTGFQKASLLIKDVLEEVGIPANYRAKYLSREAIVKYCKEALNNIEQEKAQAEKERLAALKEEEIARSEQLSILFSGTGKEKTVNFCKKNIEYYQFQIEACKAAVAALRGDTSKANALFNHKSNTWAYHGGIASAIAGPAAGVIMASEAKRKEDAMNEYNANLFKLSVAILLDKELKINKEREEYEKDLQRWEKALEATKFQLEEKQDGQKLLNAINPEVKSYKVSETGTVTLEIGFSQSDEVKIHNEKPAYVDGSIRVQFLKNNKICGTTTCYLLFGGASNKHSATCMCTSLPKLDDVNEKYDIRFLPNNLWAMEVMPDLQESIRYGYYLSFIAKWFYEKEKQIKAQNLPKTNNTDSDSDRIRREVDKLIEVKRQKQKAESKKKRKKNTIFVSVTLATLLTLAIVFVTFILSPLKYNSATKLLSDGDYLEASKIFESLGDYKDSYDKMIESLARAGEFKTIVNTYGYKEVVIPDGITEIPSSAFSGCASLTNIVIPNSVTSIGSHAFEACSKLTNITIPDSVTSIGFFAFYGCRNLTSIIIPDSVTSIGFSAFYNCSSLTSITIPDSVTSIGSSAFYGCSNLTSITIPNGITSIEYDTFCGCYSLTSITIPDSVTSIGKYAFSGCSSLTNITIPDGVTSFGDHAFSGCSSLTNITIPDGVTSFGDHAFSGCSSLTSITIPDSVTSISSYAFYNCSSLTSIVIPDTITSINKYAFQYCNSLTSITFEGTIAQWEVINKGRNWNDSTGKYTIYCTDGTISK